MDTQLQQLITYWETRLDNFALFFAPSVELRIKLTIKYLKQLQILRKGRAG